MMVGVRHTMYSHVWHPVVCLWPCSRTDRLQGVIDGLRRSSLNIVHQKFLLERVIQMLSLLVLSVLLPVQFDELCVLLL